MATHSSTLAWRILWAEEPGRLQSMGLRRVGHDWATERLHFSLSCIGEGNGNPLQCSCLENPRDRGAWWAAVYGVTQSWTRLKWLSSSSSTLLLSNVNCSWRDLFLSSSIQICDWGPLWLVGEKEEERADRNISGHWRNSFPAICYGISAGSTPTKYLQVKFFPLSHEHLQNLRF